MSEWISAKLFRGEYDELRDRPMKRSGGRFAGGGGACLARSVPRTESCASIAMDFPDLQGEELADSVSSLCGPEKPCFKEFFDDPSE